MTGVAGWLWVGYPRHDRALIVQTQLGSVVRVGTIKILGRNVMSKEVDIIKKAMADNKKVFLKEMKQLNDKIDHLDKRPTQTH